MSGKYKDGKYRLSIAGDPKCQNKPVIITDGAGNDVLANEGTQYSYNNLSDKPKLNDVELSGNKTSEDLGLADRVTIETTAPSGGMLPNKVYNLGVLSANTTFALAAGEDNDDAKVWCWTFTIEDTVPTLTWPDGVTWLSGTAPSASDWTYYEVSVMGGLGICVTASLPEPSESEE